MCHRITKRFEFHQPEPRSDLIKLNTITYGVCLQQTKKQTKLRTKLSDAYNTGGYHEPARCSDFLTLNPSTENSSDRKTAQNFKGYPGITVRIDFTNRSGIPA